MEIDTRCNCMRRDGLTDLAWYCESPLSNAVAVQCHARWPPRRRRRAHAVSKASLLELQNQPRLSGLPQSRTRRLALIDFWPGFYDNTDRWFTQDWFVQNLPGVKIVSASQEPDVILFTLFGNEWRIHLMKGSRAKLVFYTGENVRAPIGKVPLCISFDHARSVPAPLHQRLPLWVFNKVQLLDVLQMHEARLRGEIDSSVRKREGFCSWVASNPDMYNAKVRTQFVMSLSKVYKQVACGGTVLNNVGGPVKDKVAFVRNYRFHICFENASQPGYCTEKLLHAFAAGCVPIYWGDPNVCEIGREFSDFNPDALISAHDFATSEQLVKHIAQVDSDPKLFDAYLRRPILSDKWYQRLRDYPSFCKSFAELLFQDADRGTQPFPPVTPTT